MFLMCAGCLLREKKRVTFTFKPQSLLYIEHVVVVALRAVFDFISFVPGSVATFNADPVCGSTSVSSKGSDWSGYTATG